MKDVERDRVGGTGRSRGRDRVQSARLDRAVVFVSCKISIL